METFFIALKILPALILAGVLFALAVTLIRFRSKVRRVAEAVEATTPDQLEAIYANVEALGSETPNGGVLAWTRETAPDHEFVISIPEDLPDFPWAGRSYRVEATDAVRFRPVRESAGGTRLLGRAYRYIAVPRQQTKSGRLRNTYDPVRYIEASPRLQQALEAISPGHALEVLSYLLCNGRIEFDSIDQTRIGTSASWVQTPEFQTCRLCRKRMVLVLQIPGTRVHPKALHRGTFYLFGCRDHPDEVQTVSQFT
ncbi:MAG: hypothetical protein AAF657_08285 [Acidobacteriota bacterium]